MAESLNATFFAFRKREGGGVLLGASIAYVISAIVLVAAFIGAVFALMGGSGLLELAAMSATTDKPDAAAAAPNMGAIFMIFPIEMVFLFLIFVLFASYESACLRWMIRGERSGPLNLHFGADMWRVYGVYWVWFLFFVLSFIVFWIATVIIGVAVSAAVGQSNPMLAGLVVFVFCIAWVIAWIMTAVRLAPAAATTVGIGDFAPLKAWAVSRDRFWALFGSFLLLGVIYLIAVTIVMAMTVGPMYAAIFSQVDWASAQTDPAAFSRSYEEASLNAMRSMFSNPTSIAIYVIGQIVGAVVGVVFYLLYFGVNARAVQAALEEHKIQREAGTA